MSNLRKVNDDILKEWFKFREETCFSSTDDEDKKHYNIINKKFYNVRLFLIRLHCIVYIIENENKQVLSLPPHN